MNLLNMWDPAEPQGGDLMRARGSTPGYALTYRPSPEGARQCEIIGNRQNPEETG
jgi:hypothetical protein